MSNEFLDDNGRAVDAFAGRVRNLARVAELTHSVIEMAESGAWRKYRTALGEQEWLEAEYDYFLIACQLRRDDVARVLAWNSESAKLAPLMDRDAESSKRRPLEDASAAWRSPGFGTLADRAKEQGWLGPTGRLNASPVPRRARALAADGVSQEERAKRARAERIAGGRRNEIDKLVADLEGRLGDDVEYRYLIDRLLEHLATRRGVRTPKG